MKIYKNRYRAPKVYYRKFSGVRNIEFCEIPNSQVKDEAKADGQGIIKDHYVEKWKKIADIKLWWKKLHNIYIKYKLPQNKLQYRPKNVQNDDLVLWGDNMSICWEMGNMRIFQLFRGPIFVVFSVSKVFKCPHKLKLVLDFDTLIGTFLTGAKLRRWFDNFFGLTLPIFITNFCLKT